MTIRPKTKVSKIDQMRLIMEAWGIGPNEVLSKKALSRPHRTVVDIEKEKTKY